MKYLLLIVIFYLLTTASYFLSCNSCYVSSSVISLSGRRSMREHRMVSPLNHRDEDDKAKVFDDRKKEITFQEHFREQEHQSTNDLELVYHIDYNGVTTHPVPTPKHPRP